MEGITDLIVPKEALDHKKGPGTSKVDVFFNPVMEFSRDISVLVLREFVKNKKTKLLDGLAGTGARGVRIAYEVDGNYEMVINDHNPLAFKIIKKNIVINGTENSRAENNKLNILLSVETFDYIDIDPFGPPVQFLDAAMRALRQYGMLAVTATDTAPLCGAYPKTCLRRYDALSASTSYSKEIGARILAGHCVRMASKYDIAAIPVLTCCSDHYFRIHFAIKKGAKKADSARESIGHLVHNNKTHEREVLTDYSQKTKENKIIGPLWIGDLHDVSLLSKIVPDPYLNTSKKIDKYLELWSEEAQMPPYFYETDEISSLTKTQPKPLMSMIEELKGHGFLASRTHFSPGGFKTDATISEISHLVSEK
jgi:tRNA (guanine26-N2/guanine27-N2)-dimethyltransferase